MNPIYRKRRRRDVIVRFLCLAAAIFGVAWLAMILFTLFYNGLAGLNFEIFTRNTPPPGSTDGGLLNAIVGSIIMTVIGVGIGAPLDGRRVVKAETIKLAASDLLPPECPRTGIAFGMGDGFGAGLDAELVVGVGEVGLHGGAGDDELARDGVVGAAERDHAEDLELAQRERDAGAAHAVHQTRLHGRAEGH